MAEVFHETDCQANTDFLDGLNFNENNRRSSGNRGNRARANYGHRGRGAGNRGGWGGGEEGDRGNRGYRGRGNYDGQRGRGNSNGYRGRGNFDGYRGRGNAANGRGNRGWNARSQRGLQRSFTESSITDAVDGNFDLYGTGTRPRNSTNNNNNNNNRGQRKHIIGYKRLESYIEMEPDDIVIELVKVKSSMAELLKVQLKSDWVTLLMKMFALVTESSMKSNVIPLLFMLQGSRLIECLKERIQMLPIEADDVISCSKIEEFVQNIVIVFEEFLRLFPASHAELPIDNLMLALQRPSLQQRISESIRERIENLVQIREDLLKDKIQQAKTSSRNQVKHPAHPPPEDFRTLSIVPTADDLDIEKKPYLRPIKADGNYHDAEEYLDIQFRLLKEDFVQPLREGIDEIVAGMVRKDRKHNLKIYTDVRIINPICTPGGIVHRLRFDVSKLNRVPWKHSRRFLFGSLVCLSKDFNGALMFATVANRKPEDLEKGEVEVRFIGGLEAVANVAQEDVFQMVESPSFYQAYCHVLKAMQRINADEMPFNEYIVAGSCHVGIPGYLGPVFDHCTYDLRGCFTKQDRECRVKLAELNQYTGSVELNDSQRVAIEKALTSDFVVIQGPPGTGKTYVGLRIAHALLENSEYWRDQTNAQMLIVCYTNHALDQFLEGLLNMGHDSMIRVGGRCQNEALKDYCLSEIIHKDRDRDRRHHRPQGSQELRQAKYEARNERSEIESDLQRAAGQIGKVNKSLLDGKIASLTRLLPVGIQSWFNNLDCLCKQIHVGFWEVWLGIYPIPVDMIGDIRRESSILKRKNEEIHKERGESEQEAGIPNEEEDGGIEIQGEAEEMMDRWVIDDDMFQHSKDGNEAGNSDGEDDVEVEGNFVDQHGFQVVVPKKAERRWRAREILMRTQPMQEADVNTINAPWELDMNQRWSLYAYLIQKSLQSAQDVVVELGRTYEECCERLTELTRREEELYLRDSKIIAMTTTGAARLQDSLSRMKPSIVVIEEAAEVLEAHVVTALTAETQHVVLIGDHKQLKPKPSVYKLATQYKLELSLFERMLNNGMECYSLNIQHRMRPCIADLLHDIYPELENHPSVENYPDVLGVEKNLYFINHDFEESSNEELKSKSNEHEAEYIVALCWYLLMQGYAPERITVLTLYTGQLLVLKKLMPRDKFQGVRIAAVDNYQGEENDIILLSLVRNNADGKIGFTGIENRICVSLSRAKHGMFVIGSFDFLAANSKYWAKIVKRTQDMDCIGHSLKLFCRNHPESVIEARLAEDFKGAPEGGCELPCDYRLRCGHVCGKACHPVDQEHVKIKCRKQCNKERCCNGHVCRKQCHYGEGCGLCMTRISKIIPDCAHEQMVPCSIEPGDFKCKFPIEKELTCGHKTTVACHMKEESVQCAEKVDVVLQCGHPSRVACYMRNDTEDVECRKACTAQLECGHYCKGTCAKCHRGRLHMKCTSPCERPLPCSHLCKQPCSRECPPCKQNCVNFCGHSRCPKPCGEVCSPCMENCRWSCKHLTCDKLCHQQCDREPCNKPCPKRLKCGHKCIGLCREKCPKVCRICDKEAVEEIFFGNEDEEDARFIQLVDCVHFFEAGGLDQWMKQEDDDNNDASVSIKLKECPKCKTPIRKSWRYGNVIKKCMQDVNEVKKQVINQRRLLKAENRVQMSSVRDKAIGLTNKIKLTYRLLRLQEIHMILNSILSKYYRLYGSERQSAWETINSNQVDFLEIILTISDVILKELTASRDFAFLDETNFAKGIADLNAVCELSLSNEISVQQMLDADLELFRLRLFFIAYETKFHPATFATISTSVLERKLQSYVDESYRELTSGERINKDLLKKYEKRINGYRKLCGYGAITREEKEMVIKAIGLRAGHWYKCKNGHVYAIGECGGAMEESKCPECKEVIGGGNHDLAAGNEHAGEFDNSSHPAWSNMANMNNFDLNEFL
eukprot:gene5584-6273_t